MEAIQTELAAIRAENATLRSDIKSLAKIVRKIRAHQEDPTGEKQKERSKNSGFNRALEVTPALRAFMGADADTPISRSDVTRYVNAYIRENNLKHPDNGRVIVMDEKLKALLAPPEGEQISFLNIQKYISPHYVKTEKKAPEPTESTGESSTPAPAEKKAPAKRPTVRKASAKA
jgi:chromatin remodeling complex protein RSC6